MRVVCLGEALVDFVPEPPVEEVTEARAFTPSFGGSQANVAIGAERFGAPSALVGCTGADPWGRWLRKRLLDEEVDVSMFELRPDVATTMAFVSVTSEGEPSFSIYGGNSQGYLRGLEDRLQRLLADEAGGVLAFGSDTLIAEHDRDVLASLKRSAVSAGWQVLYDPNLRQARWREGEQMLAAARDGLRDVTVVKANAPEAVLLTGLDDPAEAAAALVEGGPSHALVTCGDRGAYLAWAAGVVHAPARALRVADATGAGDAVASVVAAALARGFELTPEVADVAMRAAGRVVGSPGALAGLPAREEARAMLGAPA
jgi:fructokinase